MRNILCHASKEVTNKDGKLREDASQRLGLGEKIHVNTFYIYFLPVVSVAFHFLKISFEDQVKFSMKDV